MSCGATSHHARHASVVCLAFALAGCARSSPPAMHPSAADLDVGQAELLSADADATKATETAHEANSSTNESAASGSDEGMGRTYGWIIMGVGASAGAVAIGTSFLMLHEDSVRSDGCGAQKTCSAAGLEANARLRSLAGWNVASWAVAAVGLGVGAFLVITNPHHKPTNTAVGISPNGTGLDLSVRSVF